HSTNLDTIAKYLNVLSLDKKGLKKINSLRKLVGNSVI
ncbi:RNA-directed DNA polymerase Reverse transcriptase, partial [human gut metagenome]